MRVCVCEQLKNLFFFSFPVEKCPLLEEKKVFKQNFELFPRMLFKFDFTWTRIGQGIRLWNGDKFFETPYICMYV